MLYKQKAKFEVEGIHSPDNLKLLMIMIIILNDETSLVLMVDNCPTG